MNRHTCGTLRSSSTPRADQHYEIWCGAPGDEGSFRVGWATTDQGFRDALAAHPGWRRRERWSVDLRTGEAYNHGKGS